MPSRENRENASKLKNNKKSTINGKSVVNRKDEIHKRMNRVNGQVQGIQKMIAEDRHCVDILTQIRAVHAALDGIGLKILEDHTHHTVQSAAKTGNGKKHINDLMGIFRKYAR